MQRAALLLCVCLCALPLAASEGPPPADVDLTQEPHLNIVPRTEEEAARIAAVTAAPTDFSEAQAFETNSAGAATVRVIDNANAFSSVS
ncbi:MAG: thiol oxidoreductase, partial [Pseudomonadota bacterium]